MFKHITKVLIFFTILPLSPLRGQECIGSFVKPSTENKKINWQQFNSIELPFTLIYGGPVFEGSRTKPLNFGFSHLSDYNVFKEIPKEQRAIIYYGPAFPEKNQPWELYRSPWENDLSIYAKKWEEDYFRLGQSFPESKITGDIFVYDIERQWRTDFDILQLKSNPNIPINYRNLSNEEFLELYKKDLRSLYAKLVQDFNALGIDAVTKISSYSDAPIWNTFDNIQGRSWQQWQQSKEVLNYICTDENGNVGGEFESQMTFHSPSTYYYYDYPHPFAGEYLSYLLFQIEANRAWTSKPIIPFVWLRYSFNPAFKDKFIQPWMAEATAIFPFFSGADGLWLWEDPFLLNLDQNYSTYEYFLNGLKRLEAVSSFFGEGSKAFIPESARDLNANKSPVWRARILEDKILIAAHNPWATGPDVETELQVTYKNWSRKIILKGYETKLCTYSLDELFELVVFPNPSLNAVNVYWNESPESIVEYQLIDVQGRTISTLESASLEVFLSFPTLPKSSYYLQIRKGEERITKKLILGE